MAALPGLPCVWEIEAILPGATSVLPALRGGSPGPVLCVPPLEAAPNEADKTQLCRTLRSLTGGRLVTVSRLRRYCRFVVVAMATREVAQIPVIRLFRSFARAFRIDLFTEFAVRECADEMSVLSLERALAPLVAFFAARC